MSAFLRAIQPTVAGHFTEFQNTIHGDSAARSHLAPVLSDPLTAAAFCGGSCQLSQPSVAEVLAPCHGVRLAQHAGTWSVSP